MPKTAQKTSNLLKDGDEKQFLPLAEKAHGIKNILQAIKGGMDVVDRSLTSKDMTRAKRSWEILKENIVLINDLVADMLNFTRQSDLLLERCDLNQVVSTVVHSLHVKAHEKDAQLSLHIDDAVPVIRMDIARINDVILNLILNAIEAAEQGKGQIEVRTRLDRESRKIILEVEDNGPGIEDTQAVFLPFYSSKKSHGTGLGLAICKKTIEQHRGTIEVHSEPGQGALFTVKIPT